MIKEKNIIKTKLYNSPCGILILGSLDDKLCLCDWIVAKHRESIDKKLMRMLNAKFEEGTSKVTKTAIKQLDEYFSKKRVKFDIPLLFVGTDFQKAVWKELLKIPFGKTISYKEQAQKTGLPKAVRAIANANGANAMAIIVPCHRVMGSNSSLTGFAGGLDAKRILLELEGVL